MLTGTPRIGLRHAKAARSTCRAQRQTPRSVREPVQVYLEAPDLTGQMGAEVTVTLEIDATIPDGASDQIVRIVTENSRVLKFSSHGFESE